MKVLSMSGQRISLSMRDVDQATGQDLLPGARLGADGVNPSGPSAAPSQGLHGLSGIKVGPPPESPCQPRAANNQMLSAFYLANIECNLACCSTMCFLIALW